MALRPQRNHGRLPAARRVPIDGCPIPHVTNELGPRHQCVSRWVTRHEAFDPIGLAAVVDELRDVSSLESVGSSRIRSSSLGLIVAGNAVSVRSAVRVADVLRRIDFRQVHRDTILALAQTTVLKCELPAWRAMRACPQLIRSVRGVNALPYSQAAPQPAEPVSRATEYDANLCVGGGLDSIHNMATRSRDKGFGKPATRV